MMVTAGGVTRTHVYTYDNMTITKYVYDGDHCIAEYDGSSNLRRKYVYGPCVDEPIALIEAAGSYAGTYYYHFDALGSVVGLTNAGGNTVEVYEYDVYGRLGASDASHPNRFMFTGREYDKETGLYYYRARYYNPQIGRFLQTDPVGYDAGMNLYAYCGNEPIDRTDPSGEWASYSFNWIQTGSTWTLHILCWRDIDQHILGTDFSFTGWDDVYAYTQGTGKYADPCTGKARPRDFCDGHFDRSTFGRWWNRSKNYGPPTTGGGSAGPYRDPTAPEWAAFGFRGQLPPPPLTTYTIFANPNVLAQYQTMDELVAALGGVPQGWEITPLFRGAHAGQGFVLRELNASGTDYTDRMIQWHPGGGHHGADPGWKVSSGSTGVVHVKIIM
jgi:RHS repeat-associated protein